MSKELQDLEQLCKKVYGESKDHKHITNFSFEVLKKVLLGKKDIMKKYEVTDCEIYVLLLLVGFYSDAIQRISIKTKEFTEKCRLYLNRLLMKTPQTASKVLYRQ